MGMDMEAASLVLGRGIEDWENYTVGRGNGDGRSEGWVFGAQLLGCSEV